ncbi:NAD(P)-binding protein [Pelagibius litoralis]|uniref:NAD(P)-binding protein n=1 Tax=Pelagibius litoralis TaxID=374515 RepID=A0A967F2R1_9PROT|nr:FAD-dependent oxidoreductase [Pelagibius litoralis]NIA72116.1 NAD(P)-binding protein [Pelagibius litoralis]
MKIAVVGAGITGLGAAWALDKSHDVTLFESEGRLGGHANTVDITLGGAPLAVDTGFIVYNELAYPNLTRLFEALAVPTQRSDMSFSVSLDNGRLEYRGSAAGLFIQKRNLLRPRFWSMLRDLLRFYRDAPGAMREAETASMSLGELLTHGGYGEAFTRDHLLPMGSAIWSTPLEDMLAFPAQSFIQFCENHGLLLMKGRPQWRTVTGGSREYVSRIRDALRGEVRLASPIAALRRAPDGVYLRAAGRDEERFDQVVLACHADQALRMLGAGATNKERAVLGAFRYEENRALLHTDASLMPRRRGAWASWNYTSGSIAAPADGATLGDFDTQKVSVTYWMNQLQGIDRRHPLFVTLNPEREPALGSVLRSFVYDHPLFDAAALQAQRTLPDIQGSLRTWFCGSYCGYGFHEDGLQAGLGVAAALGAPAPWAQDVIPRSPAAEAVVPAAVMEAAE